MKLVAEPNSEAAPHRRGELVAFHSEMVGRYAPSMRQRIDLDQLWRSARAQLTIASGQPELVAKLPLRCPIGLDDLLGERIEIARLGDVVVRASSEARS